MCLLTASDDPSVLRSASAQCRPVHPGLDISEHVVRGDPAGELIRHCAQARLLVVGSRGRYPSVEVHPAVRYGHPVKELVTAASTRNFRSSAIAGEAGSAHCFWDRWRTGCFTTPNAPSPSSGNNAERSPSLLTGRRLRM